MDNVVVVNGKGKMTRLYDDNKRPHFQFINHNIAHVLHDFLYDWYGLELNQTNDFRFLIDVLRDPRAIHE